MKGLTNVGGVKSGGDRQRPLRRKGEKHEGSGNGEFLYPKMFHNQMPQGVRRPEVRNRGGPLARPYVVTILGNWPRSCEPKWSPVGMAWFEIAAACHY